MLHANGDFVVDAETAKEAHNVGRVALMEDLQLPHDLVADSWFYVQHDHLVCVGVCIVCVHVCVGGWMCTCVCVGVDVLCVCMCVCAHTKTKQSENSHMHYL